jgi:(5-formylfuran-3-yl)methyl phosphate synthase
MDTPFFNSESGLPGLLVSVRNADEARVALDGGADVIDVKEPGRGSLGAATAAVAADVAAVVGERVPISLALGELLEDRDTAVLNPAIAFAKIGLAGCQRHNDWPRRWRNVIAELPSTTRPVAVVYADWPSAAAPPPDAVLAEAIAVGCQAILIDTWDKSGGTSFDHWPAQQLARYCRRVRDAGIAIVLAGALRAGDFHLAITCRPNLIAVRGAACDGGRLGTISAQRVRDLKRALRMTATTNGDKLLSPASRHKS